MQDEVNEDLVEKFRVGVWDVLRHVSRYKNRIEWVGKEIYPLLERNVEVGDEQTRLFAMKVIGEIVVNSVDPFLKSKAEKKLVEIWYSPDTDPNSKFGQDVLKWLVLLSSKWLFDDAKAKAKDDKYRVKAELLLEKLKEVLLPK